MRGISLNKRLEWPPSEAGQGEPQQRSAAGRGAQASFEPYAGVTWRHPRLSHRFAGRTQSGLTLIELMVVIAVLAILAGIGIPGFQGIVAQNRATSAANELLATLQFARSAAIAQSRVVTVLPTDGDWHGGWIVLLDGQVLRERRALGPSVTLAGEPQLIFSSTGTLAGQDINPFVLQVTSGPGASRTICMTLGGSTKVIRGPTC